MTHLVTGYAGAEHIKSEDDGSFNASFFGSGQYVMEAGNQFEGSILNNNTVRILDGDLLMYGRHIRVNPNTYEDLTIETGTAGTNRIDLICMTYEKNVNDGTESAFFEVIKGAETEGTATIPSYVDGNILDGAIKNQMPLYKVSLAGVVLSSIECMFTTIPTYKKLAETYAEEFKKSCETHLDSLGILDTMEEVQANTQKYQLAGALALKELETTLKKSVSDGKTLLATTITEKTGVEVASNASFEELNEVLNSNLGKNVQFYINNINRWGTIPYGDTDNYETHQDTISVSFTATRDGECQAYAVLFAGTNTTVVRTLNGTAISNGTHSVKEGDVLTITLSAREEKVEISYGAKVYQSRGYIVASMP